MKFKFKVNRIEHRRMVIEGGEKLGDVLLVKATPVDQPAGDLLLALPGAEIEWHPEVLADHPHPSMAGTKYVTLKKETVIQAAKHSRGTLTIGDDLEIEVTVLPPAVVAK
jgi:hypothetical protein